MRATVDTNILVRAVIKPAGTVAPVLAHVRDQRYTLVYSDQLKVELAGVLRRPRIRIRHRLLESDIEDVIALIVRNGELVAPEQTVTACRDPKDNMVLEAALAGKVDVIVSGDDDLLVLHPFEGIPIVRPREFLAMVDAPGWAR
jgi:putative PIN family toxin of toxin-antitoxin system